MNRLGPFQENTIVVGDCLNVMAQMPDGCVGLVFADPPYGAGKYEGDGWMGLEWFYEAMRLTSSFVLVTPGIENIPLMPRAGYVWTLSAWIANSRMRGKIGFGNWIPLMVYAVDSARVYRQAQDAKRIVIRGEMPNHPCPKPIEAVTWWLETFSNEGDLVFDPFIGSGTTAVVADRLGRRFFGCDINPDYVEMALERLEKDRAGRQLELL